MDKISWYKRDPDAALTGMMALSLEERGAYNTVLDLIYTHSGAVPDDLRYVAGWLRVDVRVWKRIRTRLIDLGKLYLDDGHLRNSRADREVLDALSRCASARHAGVTSGISRAAKSRAKVNGNKDLDGTPVRASVERTLEPSTTTSTTRKNKPSPPNGGSPPLDASEEKPAHEKPKRGTRLTPDWQPSEADQRHARNAGFDDLAILAIAEQFRNYFTAGPGRSKTWTDWHRAFANWISRETPGRNGAGGGKPQPRNVVAAVNRVIGRLPVQDD